ncbi:MAG: methyltransferase domain-containing protein [Alphaproteobacteria bacterium]
MTSVYSKSKTAVSDALFAQAQALYNAGNNKAALEKYHEAIEKNPECAPAYAGLSDVYVRMENLMPAIECIGIAMHLDPKNSSFKQKFIDLIWQTQVEQENMVLKEAILQCMEDGTLDLSLAGNVWFSVLIHDRHFKPIYRGALRDLIVSGTGSKALLDPYFLKGLESVSVFNVDFESFLTRLRRVFLENQEERFLPIVRALARYCEVTEFIFFVSDEEKNIFSRMRGLSEWSEIQRAILSCYERSSESEKSKPGISIGTLSEISDDVSKAVQQQYEEFPYPRWRYFDREIKDASVEGVLLNQDADILVAGCGTGKEAIELAYVFPKAKVFAVDLSRASLNYAATKAQEFGIRNIEFHHGDILKLGALDKKFDFIASSGVLHHMKDPVAGWSVLTGLLKDDGLMRIALYSKAARLKFTEAKKIIQARGYSPDDEGMRKFRADAEKILPKDVYTYICKCRDYFYKSECRDLLFHVHEIEYDPMDILKMLEGQGLEFIKFYIYPDVLEQYKKRFPKDINASSLENWVEFEKDAPETFKEMYKFWCRKKPI